MNTQEVHFCQDCKKPCRCGAIDPDDCIHFISDECECVQWRPDSELRIIGSDGYDDQDQYELGGEA